MEIMYLILHEVYFGCNYILQRQFIKKKKKAVNKWKENKSMEKRICATCEALLKVNFQELFFTFIITRIIGNFKELFASCLLLLLRK